jgi:hypothetical protein
MAITQAVCNSFKQGLLQQAHGFSALSFAITDVAAASGGTTLYTGTITGGGSNAFAGMVFKFTGLAAAANNGTFLCTLSTATTLTMTNNVGSAASAQSGTAASGGTFKIALYTSTATLDKATTAYAATNEVVGTGYTAGGNTLTNVTPTLATDTAITDFPDTSWTTATITARGALIYDATNVQNKSVAVLDFGADKSSSGGTFTIVFPAADAANAILRLA